MMEYGVSKTDENLILYSEPCHPYKNRATPIKIDPIPLNPSFQYAIIPSFRYAASRPSRLPPKGLQGQIVRSIWSGHPSQYQPEPLKILLWNSRYGESGLHQHAWLPGTDHEAVKYTVDRLEIAV
jgi:hypothetical protein